MSERSLTRTSFLVGAVSLVVKPISMLKEILVASAFGTTAAMDAFTLALSWPALLIGLLSGPLTGAFTPVLVRAQAEGRGKQVFRQMAGWMSLAMLALALLLLVFHRPLARMAGPGLDGHSLWLAGGLLLWLIPYFFFQAIAEFHRISLIAIKDFAVATALPGLLPFTVILALWWGGARLRWLVLGMGIGAFLVALASGWRLARRGFRGISMPVRSEAMQKVAQQAPFILMSGMLLQLNVFVDRMMASTLPEGSVAALGFAFKLLMLLQMVLVAPFTQLLLPYLSADVANEDWGKLLQRIDRSMRSALIILLPVLIFGIIFGGELVAFFYERKNFTPESTQLTAAAFLAYLPTLLVLGSTMAYPRYFNASGDNRFLLVQTSLSAILNVFLNWWLMGRYGHVGIALSTSITILIGRALLYGRIRFEMREYGGLAFGRHLGTLLLAGVVAVIMEWADIHIPEPGGHLMLRLALAALATLLVFLLVVGPFRMKDLMEIWSSLRRKSA